MEKAEEHLHLLSLELTRTHSLVSLARRNDTAVSCKKFSGTPDAARNSLKNNPKPTKNAKELGYDLSW